MTLLLVACGTEEPLAPLPEGIQTLSGVILPTELSLVRRGTHVLTRDEEEVYFLESPLVTLRNYEQKIVTVRGVIESNIDATFLPVFIVDSVVDVESTTRDWGVRQIDLSLTTPRTWQQRNTEGQVQFFVEGVEQPILTLDEQKFSGELPVGVSIVVDGNPAVQIVNEENGNQAVYVLRGNSIVTFLFTPRSISNLQALRSEWLSVLSSVEFGADTPTDVVSGTGAISGPSCGGFSGILCPEGSYCEVVDTETDVGVCKSL